MEQILPRPHTGLFWAKTPMERQLQKPKQLNSGRLFTLIAASIFIVEFALMLGLQYIFGPTPPLQYLIGSASLIIITYPVLYYFFFSPTLEEIARHKKGESQLFSQIRELKDAAAALDNEKMSLAKTKAEDEAMLDNIAHGVIAVDKGGKIILINGAAQTMLQRGSGECLGREWFKILRREDEAGSPIPPEKGPIKSALSESKITTDDIIYIMRKDGTKFPASNTVSPVMLNGKVIGVINLFRDITREREIDRAKSEFVSLASHQLRTPTTAIHWFSKMLLNQEVGKINREQKRYLHYIYEVNKRMIGLVTSLLDVSRIELGTFAINPETVSLPEICNNLIEELKPEIDAKKIKVVTRYRPSLPKIPADPKLIYIIFQNLLTNAVAYSRSKGRITVDISVKKDPGGGYYLLSVEDAGIGIPEGQQKNIFTKLFRADNAREMVTDGTGLGLYIVKSILERTGGSIWFRSPPPTKAAAGEKNKGSIFYVKLPLLGMKQKQGSGTLL